MQGELLALLQNTPGLMQGGQCTEMNSSELSTGAQFLCLIQFSPYSFQIV